MSAASQQLAQLFKQYMRIVERWPVDKLRPTHCFKTTLKEYVQKEFQPSQKVVDESVLAKRVSRASNEIKALETIMANKAFKKYPLSNRLRHPVDRPNYYDDMIKAIDATANKK